MNNVFRVCIQQVLMSDECRSIVFAAGALVCSRAIVHTNAYLMIAILGSGCFSKAGSFFSGDGFFANARFFLNAKISLTQPKISSFQEADRYHFLSLKKERYQANRHNWRSFAVFLIPRLVYYLALKL